MSIPIPNVEAKEKDYKSDCELYDGTPDTGGLCSGWVTKNGKCMKRNDDRGAACDGYGNKK